jgi:hypothetical protein
MRLSEFYYAVSLSLRFLVGKLPREGVGGAHTAEVTTSDSNRHSLSSSHNFPIQQRGKETQPAHQSYFSVNYLRPQKLSDIRKIVQKQDSCIVSLSFLSLICRRSPITRMRIGAMRCRSAKHSKLQHAIPLICSEMALSTSKWEIRP